MRVQLQDRVTELQEVSLAVPPFLHPSCPTLLPIYPSLSPWCRKPRRPKLARRSWP